MPYHFGGGGVNATIYLQLFQDFSYNHPVGIVDCSHIDGLQVDLRGLEGVVSHALADGGYRNVHVQGDACPCMACHVGGERNLQANHLADVLQVVVSVVFHLTVCGIWRGFLACQDG